MGFSSTLDLAALISDVIDNKKFRLFIGSFRLERVNLLIGRKLHKDYVI